MSRSVSEWRGKTDDDAIPPRVQLRIFQKFSGICPKCTRKLEPGKWDCDHIIALALGGDHREMNLRPLCRVPCHSDKTRDDAALRKRFNASQKKRAGIKKRRRTIAGRKFDGTPIPSRWIG